MKRRRKRLMSKSGSDSEKGERLERRRMLLMSKSGSGTERGRGWKERGSN
jgi:hypothetical protein